MDFNKFCSVALFFLFTGFASFGFQILPEWLSTGSYSENTLPSASRLIPFTSEAKSLSFDPSSSSNYKNLNGNWRFKWYKNKEQLPAEFSDPKNPVQSWDPIPVPSYWQMVGLSSNKTYDKPIYLKSGLPNPATQSVITSDSNAIGIYRSTFELPTAWKNKSVVLHFDGVGSACYVWLNGYKLGYHEDSKTSFAFQIDSLVNSGVNHLTVQVLKWNDGSYLENHEGWQLSGIFRDVYLTMHDEIQIRDLFISTKLDEHFKDATLNLRTTIKNNKNYIQYGLKIKTTLYDENKKMVGVPSEKTINILDSISQLSITHSMTVANPQKWSAEVPALYSLTVQLVDEKDRIFEVISQKVGFREIGFKTNQLLLNGKAITVKGVNMSTSSPLPATLESMVRNIVLMKQHNINAVWLNHGPHHPVWYELCNEYGIYVINEANIQIKRSAEANNTAGLKNALFARAQQMWERDKNHPSVIAWSTGNYFGSGNNPSSDLQSYFQLADATRPIISQGSIIQAHNDHILTSNSSTVHDLEALPRDNAKPLLLKSFGQSDGNGLGGIYAFWQALLKSAARQGGFLERWSDNIILTQNEDGESIEYRNYEVGEIPTGGVVSTLGTPEPEIKELKKAYEPVIITSADTISIHNKGFIITNKFDFQTLNDFELKWSLEENGQSTQTGLINLKEIKPNQSKEIKFPFEWPPHPRPDGTYYLNLRIIAKADRQWLKKGHEIASKQIPLKIGKIIETASFQYAAPLRMNFLRGIGIEITGADFSVTFDKETAQMSSYVYKDKEFLETGFEGNFWRVPTSSDHAGGPDNLANQWLKNGIDSLRTASSDLRVEKLNNHIYKVSTVKRLAARAGNIQVNTIYTVYASGDVHIQYAFIPSGSLPLLPRIGLQMQMRENMNEIMWFGKGPHETYADRKYSAFTSLYSQNIKDQHFPYYPAQETGNKTDVSWFVIKDIENDGLLFIPDSLVNINIQNYASRDLFKSQQTGNTLQRGGLVVLNMDLMHEGLNFNHKNNPSPATHRFSFRIKPVSTQTDYFSEANKRLPIVARKMSPGLKKETD